MGKEDVLTNYMAKFLTGFAMSKAILEDYAKMASKIEGVTEKEIKERVGKRAEEIFQEAKKEAANNLEKEKAEE